jgi:two-component system, cell cycle sensor histidine kinase and response regulator CckA
MRTPEEQDCILIVDDDPDQRTLLATVLGHAGFRVVAAGGARDGFELARRERPDLIISDVVMPELSGIDLCRMIRADAELRAVPILLLSAIDKRTKSMVEALQTGADDYVEIPFEPHLLVARATRLLERKRFEAELEQRVAERTTQLEATNQRLEGEIEERERTEKALERSHYLLRAIIDGIPDPVFMKDAGGRYVLGNAASAAFVDKPLEEVIGRADTELFEPEKAARIIQLDRSIVAEGTPRTYEKSKTTAAGETRTYQATKFVHRNEQGNFVGLIGVLHDITERQQAAQALLESERRLQQSQRMEAIGQLAGGVAHDFNNYLTAILGYAQLAMRALAPESPLQRHLVEVQKAAERASTLTRQLLAFSRRQHLERRAINLGDTISEIMKLLRRIIGEDVEVRLIVASNLWTVFADPAQIEQVVMNLAVNSRDAMPQGGRLTIETSNVTLDEGYRQQYPYVRPGKYVQITVSDTGTGITPETQKHIFEPFFTTKEIGKGTGLGLATVYGIVKQHEGHIHVYSEVGHGTTFKIYLPAADKEAEHEARPVEQPLHGGAETILVAEDEEALRVLASEILEGLGYTVLSASNGEEAVKIYRKNQDRIDLLLLDIVMPSMGGIKAYERIREIGGDVPAIFMTGYSSETVQSQFIVPNKWLEEAGAFFVQKPYSVEGLGRKVREVLDAAQANREK